MVKRKSKRMRLAQRRRKRNMWIFFLCASFAIGVYAALGHVSVNDNLEIKYISVQGNNALNAEELAVTVERKLAKVRFKLFYGGTVFTYDKKSIIDDLLREYPRLKRVNIRADGISTLILDIDEREPSAMWCAYIKNIKHDCYFMDENGFVFEKISDLNDAIASGEYDIGNMIEYKGYFSGRAIGKTFLPDHFNSLRDFIDRIKTETSFNVKYVEIFDDEAEIYGDNMPTLKIKLNDDLQKVLSYLKITVNSESYRDFSMKKDLNNSDGNDGYIDLRFGNRVYYK